MKPNFIPGLELSARFYRELVWPILDRSFPSCRHSAALIGAGSEVLGYDTEMSADHDWGPRVRLFLEPDDFPELAAPIEDCFRKNLPESFIGYPVGSVIEGPTGNRPVELTTPKAFFAAYLGFDIDRDIEAADWLSLSEHKLLTVAKGAVFHDAIGLRSIRDRFAYYPRDVWLYLLAAQWKRIGQEEHLMGRAGLVGDELGSALIAARLVRDVMRLCFLMEKRYAPYAKWFGRAFGELKSAVALKPFLTRAVSACDWRDREEGLVGAYRTIAAMHNTLDITNRMRTTPARFHQRPFRVIGGELFAEAIRARIVDPEVRRIADQWIVGSVDQWSDNVDLVNHSRSFRGFFS